MYGWLGLGATLALIGAFLLGDHMGASRERDRCKANKADNQDKAAVEVNRRDEHSAEARTSMLDYLAAEKPAIEIRTHDTITKIREVYRDKPMPAVCVRPDSVRDSLNAARDSANASIGRM